MKKREQGTMRPNDFKSTHVRDHHNKLQVHSKWLKPSMLSYKKTIIVNKDFHNNEKQDNNSCWYSLARPLLSFKKFQETLLFITTLHFKKLKIIEIWYKI